MLTAAKSIAVLTTWPVQMIRMLPVAKRLAHAQRRVNLANICVALIVMGMRRDHDTYLDAY